MMNPGIQTKNKFITLLKLVAMFITISCSNSDDIEKKTSDLNEQPVSVEDSMYTINYFDENKIKSEGLLIKGRKYGLWRSYDETGNLTNAQHYFNDSLKYNMDVSDYVFDKATKSELTYYYPKTWESISSLDSSVIASYMKRCDSSYAFCPNLIIRSESKKGSLEDMASKVVELLPKSFSKFKLINIESSNVANSIKITFIGRVNNVKLGGVCYLLLHNDRVFDFTFLGNNNSNGQFVADKDIMDEIIRLTELKLKANPITQLSK